MASKVDVSGGYAYIADGLSGLQVVDVSAPTAPVLVAALDTPGQAEDVRVAGDYAFVADATSGLHVVDISNRPAPVLAASTDTPGAAVGLAVGSEYLYIADFAFGLLVLPRLCAEAPTPVTLSELHANATDARVHLSWRLAAVDLPDLSGVHVQSALRPDGPYSSRTLEPLRPQTDMEFVDAAVSPGAYVWYRIALIQGNGSWTFSQPILVRVPEETTFTTSLGPTHRVPEGVLVHYAIAAGVQRVRLAVHDARGRLVRVLQEGTCSPGEHTRIWGGDDDRGDPAPSGVYFMHLRADTVGRARKTLWVR